MAGDGEQRGQCRGGLGQLPSCGYFGAIALLASLGWHERIDDHAAADEQASRVIAQDETIADDSAGWMIEHELNEGIGACSDRCLAWQEHARRDVSGAKMKMHRRVVFQDARVEYLQPRFDSSSWRKHCRD